MLENKWFIAILVLMLISVVAYNIQYFSSKDNEVISDEEEVSLAAMNAPLQEIADSDQEPLKMNSEMEMATRLPEPPQAVRPQKAPVQLASLEALSAALPPFSPEGMARNPFLTEEEALQHRANSSLNIASKTSRTQKKRSVRKSRQAKRRASAPISSASLKMIYRLGETAYVWIQGKAWREGEQIGKERIARINEGSILLERAGKQRILVMQRASKGWSEGVQIDFSK